MTDQIAGFTASTPDPIRDIAAAVQTGSNQLGQAAYRQGIVLNVTATGCNVLISGDTIATGEIRYLSSYLPQVNDVVWLVAMAGDIWILGSVGLQGTARDEVTVEFVPTGTLDSGRPVTFTTWFTLGNVTVPDWAGSADYSVTMTNVYAVTAAPTSFRLRLGIGTAAADVSNMITITTLLATNGYTINPAWSGSFTVTHFSAGVKPIIIQDMAVTAAGAIRVDINSQITARIRWRP